MFYNVERKVPRRMSRDQLGPFEMKVLQVLLNQPRDCYGLAIIDRLAALGTKSSIGAVYTTLERLEAKGFVRSEWTAPTAQRGGRRKRIFEITADGQRSVRETLAAQAAFNVGLAGLGGALA